MSRNRFESLLIETSKIPDHAIVTVTVGIISHRRVFLMSQQQIIQVTLTMRGRMKPDLKSVRYHPIYDI